MGIGPCRVEHILGAGVGRLPSSAENHSSAPVPLRVLQFVGARSGAVFGPSEEGPRQPLTTSNDHESAADGRTLVVCLSS
jgi:hypothetical protein